MVAILEYINCLGNFVVSVDVYQTESVANDIVPKGSYSIANLAGICAVATASNRIAVPFQGEGPDGKDGNQQCSDEQQGRYAKNAFVHSLLLCKK
jgi:hypothetical protein